MQPQDATLFTHRCQGGDLDGYDVTSRFPDGFLLVDKPDERVLIYQHDFYADAWIPDGVRSTLDHARSWAGADGNSYDIIALGR